MNEIIICYKLPIYLLKLINSYKLQYFCYLPQFIDLHLCCIDNNSSILELQNTMSKFQQLIDGLADLYLYPDQVIFGHLMNPHIKCPHNYEVANTQKDENKEIIIYQKQMSKTKINSMLNLMQGKSNPLFKSSLSKSNQIQGRQSEDQHCNQDQEDYDQDEDSYEDQMYMLQKDYENYYDQQYDEQQNPIMALGQSAGVLPKMKNLKSYNYNGPLTSHNYMNPHLYKSDTNVNNSLPNKQIDLAKVKSDLIFKNTQKTKQQKKSNKAQNKKTQSQQEWQTQSQEEIE